MALALVVAALPKLYGPHAPVIVPKTSNGCARTPHNLKSTVGCPVRTPIKLHLSTGSIMERLQHYTFYIKIFIRV